MTTAVLFELHHLGDAVLSVPFVRSMQQTPGHTLHVVCRGGSAEIFRRFLPSSQIHCWEPWWELKGRQRWSSFFRVGTLLKALRALQLDCAFCVWADSRVHWLMRQTSARETVGFPVNRQNFYAHERPWRWRRMRIGQFFGLFAPLSRPLGRMDYQQSHLTDWQQLTETAGLFWNAATPWFEVRAHPDAASLHQSSQPVWLIHPGGRLPTKRWPLERFQQLLSTTFRDRLVLLIEPPDSPALLPASHLHRSVSARDVDELLSYIQSADAVLCNDSLVSHLAAALGKPVWTIFGSGNPNWFAPYENHNRVIASEVCPFRPCIDRCVYASPICLEAVSVESVAENLISLHLI